MKAISEEPSVLIDRDALELAFRVILSCETPEGTEQECTIFELLESMGPLDVLDYQEILSVYKPNANVVLRRLRDFAALMIDPAPEAGPLVVRREHVLRHFASTYHLNQVVAPKLRDSYQRVLDIPSWFVGHLILPCEVVGIAGELAEARFVHAGGAVRLRNLYVPPGLDPRPSEIWGVHFSHVLWRMAGNEESVSRMLIEASPVIGEFLRIVQEIDYVDFQRHGDYCRMSQDRFHTYY